MWRSYFSAAPPQSISHSSRRRPSTVVYRGNPSSQITVWWVRECSDSATERRRRRNPPQILPFPSHLFSFLSSSSSLVTGHAACPANNLYSRVIRQLFTQCRSATGHRRGEGVRNGVGVFSQFGLQNVPACHSWHRFARILLFIYNFNVPRSS